MSATEIGSRVREEAGKRVDLLLARAGFSFTEEAMATPQRQGHFFFEAADVDPILSILGERFPEQAESIVREGESICAHRFRLLGYGPIDYGKRIDWHRDAIHEKRAPLKPWFKINYFDAEQVGDPKIIWELNRHQHLVMLAKAYRLTRDQRFTRELFDQWYSWQAANPYPMGINWASSLEVAFRSISWLWVIFLLEGTEAVPARFRLDVADALSVAGRHIEHYLSTYTSPNTHLLGEVLGLFFIGTLCPQLPSAARWQQQGWEILLEQGRRQVRPDGFHFEQSTYYHVYAVDMFLHGRMLAGRNDIAIPAWFDQTLERMMECLCVIGQAGVAVSFGDDDGGRVFDSSRNLRGHLFDPLSTGAVMFGRGDFKSRCDTLCEESLWLLGESALQRFEELLAAKNQKGSTFLPDSGLYVMTDSSAAPTQLLIDAGPLGSHSGGHGHADALQIHLSAGDQELLTDPGTFQYGGDGEGRRWFRSTAAHNTLQVDELDQAEARGPFAWARLPTTKIERWICGQQFDVFHGSHDGYERRSPAVTHERWVVNFRSQFWLVRDVALGAGEHDLNLAWHLAPGVFEDGDAFFTSDQATGLKLLAAGTDNWSKQVREEEWSGAYGKREPATTVHYRYRGLLPAEFGTALVAGVAVSQPGSFTRARSGDEAVAAWQYETRRDQFGAIFARLRQTWSLGEWASDADVVCYHAGDQGLMNLLFCNGSYLDFAGQRLVSSGRAVGWCEMVRNGSSYDVFSPERESITVGVSSARESQPVSAMRSSGK